MKKNTQRNINWFRVLSFSLAGLVPSLTSAQVVLFSEDFENLSEQPGAFLEGLNGWEAARMSSNTPTVNKTATFGISAAGAPDGGFAQKQIGNLGLTPTSRLQLDAVLALSNTVASSGQFNVAIGAGPRISLDVDTAPLHMGAQYGGFYFRQNAWGNSATAVDGTGSPIILAGTEIYHVRSIWDFAANTGSLMQRNITQGEEEFTTLFFDPGQTISEVGLGDYPDVTTWDTAWIRIGTSAGSRLLEFSLTNPDASSEDTWAGYSVQQGAFVDTGSFLGVLYIGEVNQRQDWVYTYLLQKWIYLPEALAENPAGAWVYVPVP